MLLEVHSLLDKEGKNDIKNQIYLNYTKAFFTFMHWRRKWQPTPVFLPGESQGQQSWWAAVCWVAQSRTRLK